MMFSDLTGHFLSAMLAVFLFVLGLIAFAVRCYAHVRLPSEPTFTRRPGIKRIFLAIQHEGITGPRMPPDIYHTVKEQVHAAFRRRFVLVASPIPGPQKKNHGDIDVLVAIDPSGVFKGCKTGADMRKALERNGKRELTRLQKLIGATHVLTKNKHSVTAQFAVPWPEDSINDPSRRIQIDLHICVSREDFEWQLFLYAHRDLFWMFKTMLNPFGLRLGVEGLQLRISEIEGEDHLILLSKKPAEIITFLGLSPWGPEWEETFATNDELLQFTTTSRFFRDFGDENITESDQTYRIRALRLYRYWVKDFVPQCREQGIFDDMPPMTKESIRDEVMQRFSGPRYYAADGSRKIPCFYACLQDEYDTRILNYLKQQQIDLFKRVIKPAVPLPRQDFFAEWLKTFAAPHRKVLWLLTRAIRPGTPPPLYHHQPTNWRGVCAKAFLKIITQDDDNYGVAPPKLGTPDGLYLEKEIQSFIAENCRVVGEAAWEIQIERYLARKAWKEMVEHVKNMKGGKAFVQKLMEDEKFA